MRLIVLVSSLALILTIPLLSKDVESSGNDAEKVAASKEVEKAQKRSRKEAKSDAKKVEEEVKTESKKAEQKVEAEVKQAEKKVKAEAKKAEKEVKAEAKKAEPAKKTQPAMEVESANKTQSAKKETKTSKAQNSINLSRFEVCTAVENRAPVGGADSFSKDVGKLYCFTHVTGAKDTVLVKHIWYLDGKAVGGKELSVKSASWRTWSSKTILPEMTGQWKVEIVDLRDNTVIETKSFVVQ